MILRVDLSLAETVEAAAGLEPREGRNNSLFGGLEPDLEPYFGKAGELSTGELYRFRL